MTTATFTEVLQADVARLQARHPLLAGALDKAFALVAGGHVFPLEDGRSAHIRSQSTPALSHLVGDTCDCPATTYHAAPCAHRLAWRLYQRVSERLTLDPAEERWEPVPGGSTSSDVTPLPEAPASANVRLTVGGRDVQLTLRDTDETRLLERLAAVLAQYPLPQPAPQASSQPQGQGKDWCQKHQIVMQANEKDGRRWFSHRTDEGWCKGK